MMGGIMPADYHAAYEKKYYTDPEKRERRAERARQRWADPENRPKILARLAVRREIAAGRMTRLPCEECGHAKSEAHHPDYSHPLEVEWLCAEHHRQRHPRPRKPLPGKPVLLTVCHKGHPYDEANTYVRNGRRYCRACNAAAVARYKAKATRP